VSKFLSVTGPKHCNSELTGMTFDPSGTRMFFSSQRAFSESDQEPGPGAIYEITGPFKGAGARAASPTVTVGGTRAAVPSTNPTNEWTLSR